jgi:PAS domain S-box-containing protein
MKVLLNDLKNPKHLLKIGILAVIYYFFAKFGLSLAGATAQVSLIWPATGIAIAALFVFGLNLWPGILIGAFIANLTTNETISMALMIAFGNSMEAYVAVFLLKKLRFNMKLARVRDVLIFVFIAALFAPVISASIGTSSLILGGIGDWNAFWDVWLHWWTGNAIGALVVSPFIFLRTDFSLFRHINIDNLLSETLFSLIIIFISLLIFTPFVSVSLSRYPFEYAIFPVMILASLRHRQKGSTWKTLLISALAVWGTVNGYGPFFIQGDIQLSLLFIQIFVGILAITFLVFSALVEERDENELSLALSEEKFRHLIENSTDAIVLIDEIGILSYVSPSTTEIIGYTEEEHVGMNVFDIIHSDDVPLAKKIFKSLLEKQGNSARATLRLKRKDGEVIWVEGVATNLIHDQAVEAVVLNYKDITEHQKMDQVKNEFVAFTAHELRGPLSTTRWYTEVLIDIKNIDSKVKDYILAIYSATLRMTDTVNMLLNLSRMEMGTLASKPVPTNPVNIIKQTIITFGQDIKAKELNIKEDYPKKPYPIVELDPNLLGIIFSNLISNAIKYSLESGQIEIKISVSKEHLAFEIKDYGIGIPESQKTRIFTKSFRADNVKQLVPQGTGLGLYLTKYVVDRIGGEIGFESEQKKGTRFWVKLPLG